MAGQKRSTGEWRLYSKNRPIYIPSNLVDITNELVDRIKKIERKDSMDTFRYIPHWRVKKFRAQRLRIHMLGIQQALVIFPWWRPDFLTPLCIKCGGLTYPIQKPFEDKNAFYLCWNQNCDFAMYTNYK